MIQEDNSLEQRDTVVADVPWIRKLLHDEGIEIQALDISTGRNLVAVADTGGHLRIGRNQRDDTGGHLRIGRNQLDDFCYSYKNPTTIRNLRFTSDGRHLLTVGGRDSCLLQWEIKL